MSALMSTLARRVGTDVFCRSLLHSTSVASFTSYYKPSNPKFKAPNNQTRSFFNKPLPRDAITPILFGGGILGVALGIAFYYRRQEFKYADHSYHPVYKNLPSSTHKKDEPASITTSKAMPTVRVPAHVQHIVIGAGAAGMAAARSIRGSDPLAQILMISGDESCGEPSLPETRGLSPPPYIRPLLSKGLWWRKPERRQHMLTADGDIRKHSWLYFEPPSFFIDPTQLGQAEVGGVGLLHNNPVVSLQPDHHQVTLSDGQKITYDCCLIATGARPRRLLELERCSHSGADLSDRVTYFRSLADYRYLQAISDKLHKAGGKIAVIGGGPLGCELSVSISGERKLAKDEAASESAKDVEFSVLHLFTDSAPMTNILPPTVATKIADFEVSKGVILNSNCTVARISLAEPEKSPLKSRLKLLIHRRGADGRLLKETEEEVDHVVIAAGVEPRTELAETANLELDLENGGFLVNSKMEARADVFVAGDAASFWDAELGCRRRVEHLNYAEETGALAGLSMASVSKSPLPPDAVVTPPETLYNPGAVPYQPAFWCSLGSGAAFDAVGKIDSRRLLTRGIFFEEAKKPSRGVVFYLTPQERVLVGILLWNLPEDIYKDTEFAAPSRLSVARHVLRDRVTIDSDDEEKQLTALAQLFDLPEEIQESYAELKAFTETKKKELEALEEKEAEEEVAASAKKLAQTSDKKVDSVAQSPKQKNLTPEGSATRPTAVQ